MATHAVSQHQRTVGRVDRDAILVTGPNMTGVRAERELETMDTHFLKPMPGSARPERAKPEREAQLPCGGNR